MVAGQPRQAGDLPRADVERLALSIPDVPLKVCLGGHHLKYLVEPPLEILRRRRRAVKVYASTSETRALQFEFDVVIFRVRVRDSNGLACTKREETSPPVESENAIVVHVEVNFSATLEGGSEDQLAAFKRVFEVVPSLRLRSMADRIYRMNRICARRFPVTYSYSYSNS